MCSIQAQIYTMYVGYAVILIHTLLFITIIIMIILIIIIINMIIKVLGLRVVLPIVQSFVDRLMQSCNQTHVLQTEITGLVV